MNRTQNNKLNKILNDKTSGSSELLYKINKLLFESINDREAINRIVNKIKKDLDHFMILTNYLRKLKTLLSKNDLRQLENFFQGYSDDSDKFKRISDKLKKKIPKCKSILTISRSGTFLNVISLADPERKLEISVLESRPKNEGRLTAKELLSKGFKVKLITDAMMAKALKKSDSVIIGADSILKNKNVVNKSGSLPLAILCKEYKKPLYVITTKSKFSKKQNFKPIKEKSASVWNYKNPKLSVENFPFEEIDKKLITSIITE